MNQVRFYSKPIALLLGLAMIISSCAQFDSSTSPETSQFSGKEVFEGVFFSSNTFAHKINSYNENVNAFKGMSSTQRAEFDASLSTLLTSIEKNDPQFFEDFKSEILSRDHQRIKKAIIGGGKQLYTHLEVLYPNAYKVVDKVKEDFASGEIASNGVLDRNKLEAKSEEYRDLLTNNMITSESGREAACSFVLVCAVYFVLAVHNQVAVTFNVAAAITVAVAVAATVTVAVTEEVEQVARVKGINADDLLAFEILVHDLATLTD